MTSLGDIDDFADSVVDVGILTPVTVCRRTMNGGGYTLIAGHRRVVAAEQVGIDSVPTLNVGDDLTDEERLLGTLFENLLRLDLDPIEKAEGYERLLEAGWSQNKIARRLQRSKGHVSKRRRLLGLHLLCRLRSAVHPDTRRGDPIPRRGLFWPSRERLGGCGAS